ncbi:PHP domain-containing protein [Fusobacteria bacterium ZRK30]|nr:PHP domain-containing protein [Fusobacteria bacterium ZRK30]
MNKKNFKIDLHIHTLESRDFKGDKSENSLDKVLEEAIEAELDLICFTDHFSVKGFDQYDKKKKKLLEMIDTARSYGFYGEEPEKLKKLYTAVKVLMGVEIKVDPGIHYLVIFNKNITIEKAEEYLISLTELDNEKARETFGDPKYSIPLNSKQFFLKTYETFGEDALIIGAHVDSSSGFFETLKQCGEARLKILSDPLLKAVEFNKVETKQKIIKNFLPETNRENIAFIQNSDFHGKPGEKLGSFYFTIREDDEKLTFDLIKKSFEKNQGISTAVDTAKERYELLIKNEIKFDFDIDNCGFDSQKEQLAKTVCALSNSEIGIINFKIILNKANNEKEIIDTFTNDLSTFITKSLDGNIPIFKLSHFNFTKGSSTIILKLPEGRDLILYEGSAYILDKNEIRKGTSNEIQSIVAKKMFYKFGKTGEKILHKVNEHSKRLKNNLLGYAIAYKVENSIIPYDKFKVRKVTFNDHPKEILNLIADGPRNGNSEGDYSIISFNPGTLKGGRLKNSYSRLSLPTFKISNLNCECKKNEIKKGEILIIPRGACFVAEKDLTLIIDCEALILEIPKDDNPYDLLMYLKSSFFQWYIGKIYNFNDVFEWVYSFQNKGFPILKEIENLNNISLKASNLILDEKKLLKVNEKKRSKESEIVRKITKHNSKGDNVCKEIDEIIFKHLNLKDDEIKEIYEGLNNVEIYDYGALEKIKEEEEESKSKNSKG